MLTVIICLLWQENGEELWHGLLKNFVEVRTAGIWYMGAATTAHPANAMTTALIPAGITEERDDEKGKELSAQGH